MGQEPFLGPQVSDVSGLIVSIHITLDFLVILNSIHHQSHDFERSAIYSKQILVFQSILIFFTKGLVVQDSGGPGEYCLPGSVPEPPGRGMGLLLLPPPSVLLSCLPPPASGSHGARTQIVQTAVQAQTLGPNRCDP